MIVILSVSAFLQKGLSLVLQFGNSNMSDEISHEESCCLEVGVNYQAHTRFIVALKISYVYENQNPVSVQIQSQICYKMQVTKVP